LPRGPRVVTFGVREPAIVRAIDVRYTPSGSEWALEIEGVRAPVRLPLLGDFNVANAVGAAAAAWGLGAPLAGIADRLTNAPQVPGRLEVIGTRPTVLRDYAHTPDALARALEAVRPFATRRMIVVFGCGGDRDRGKRAPMGRIAAEHADLAIVTSDNPRTEDPERILDDIEAGMPPGSHERFVDRRDAIARALSLAEPDDVVVLAGKGHETYQVRGTTRYPFDEQAIVRELMSAGARE
jgi:UDP-N-acetylmuramoyl-L-alanyl-D-glutamate--2,6-diaminopimelate ligase